VKFKPDIITLNEIDTTGQANTILEKLKKKMPGVPWTFYYLGSNRGNMILSRLPITATSRCIVNSGANRQVAHVSLLVNGRPLNVWNAHLALDSSKVRTSETRAIQACQEDWPEARIAAGDYNMQADTAEYKSMAEDHTDAWRAAKSMGKAINYSGNCDGCTRNSRIDYVFTSKRASWLKLKSVEIIDTRNSKGVKASDHKPMLVVYDIK
jgi:endonuclease/exonuclease/phosphatase family metal-dependent hydrolase